MSTSFPLDGMRVRFAGGTNVGMKRDHNEDAFFLPDSERLCLVADGMGGHASGEVASRLAIETITEYFRETADEQELTWPYKMDRGFRHHINRLVTGFKLANLRIYDEAQANPKYKGMGTTLVGCYFLDDALILAHVGDSRIYRLREGLFDQLTEDHSLLNDYIKMKHLTPEEIAAFPHKNVIVRALGMKANVQVDTLTTEPRLGDIYLLCTDGLSGMLPDTEIAELVASEADMDRLCDRLIEAANLHGGQDNITVVVARIERE